MFLLILLWGFTVSLTAFMSDKKYFSFQIFIFLFHVIVFFSSCQLKKRMVSSCHYQGCQIQRIYCIYLCCACLIWLYIFRGLWNWGTAVFGLPDAEPSSCCHDIKEQVEGVYLRNGTCRLNESSLLLIRRLFRYQLSGKKIYIPPQMLLKSYVDCRAVLRKDFIKTK